MNPFMKTLKKIAAAYNGISLILRIAIGLVVGVILALVCPGATWLQELGNLFVGALKGIAPVLVFVIVASALAQGSSKLDRRLCRLLLRLFHQTMIFYLMYDSRHDLTPL